MQGIMHRGLVVGGGREALVQMQRLRLASVVTKKHLFNEQAAKEGPNLVLGWHAFGEGVI